MDGLNFQPTGRFDGARKKRARTAQFGIGQTGLLAQVCQLFAQLGIGQHGPGAQPQKQAVLHLGSGGFGVGEAQNTLRLRPL